MCVLDIQLLITFKILISFFKLQIFNLEYGRGGLRLVLVCNFHATMAEDLALFSSLFQGAFPGQ